MKKNQHIKTSLLPFSWLYGLVVSVRNKLFDWNIFKQKQYPEVSVICVGNLTVGGTGKTPHIEYLVELLKPRYKVAVLSRGYKRQSSGFILADEQSSCMEIGDEPFQIKRKYPEIMVAVDKNRQNGIERLMKLPENIRPEVILLDDGFQHRWVKPSYTIVLSDYNRPIYEDTLLPAGRLRETIGSLTRANIVLVTKCPKDMKPIDMRIASNSFKLFPYQSLMFTTTTYGQLTPLDGNCKALALPELVGKEVLLVTGIASPDPLVKKLSEFSTKVKHLAFADHHNFIENDLETIAEQFSELTENKRMIVVTEKDAVRLSSLNLPEEIKPFIYYIPIKVVFLNEEENLLFNKKILNHVRKNSRDSKLHKAESI
ncbi:MAG: tetraacyldisaccharide 4'-kinase [Bacteroidales bacterium 45-6]|nr:MAG: tetraacyldisaccharide 4'-kinase [Bacteroidales bacterium 45-6]